MMKRLEQFDSYELRTAMIFGWLFAFSVFGFVVTMQIPGWDFAPFALAVFAIMCIVESVHWGYKAFAPSNANDATEYADGANDAESAQAGEKVLDAKDLRYYQHVRTFLHGVVENKLLSTTAWNKVHKWPAPAVMDYMQELARAGVVIAPSQGKAAQLLVSNIDEAWDKLDQMEGFDIRAAIERSLPVKQSGKVLAGYSPTDD